MGYGHGECGKALIGQAAHGRTHVRLYYGHSKVDEKSIKCSIKRFNAKRVEKAVLNHLDEMLRRSGHLDQIENNIKSYLSSSSSYLVVEKKAKENELHDLDIEIDNIFKVHFSMEKGTQGYQLVAEKLEALAQRKKNLKAYLTVLNDKLATVYDAKEVRLNLEEKIKTFHQGWKKANPIVQKRLLRRLVDCLYYTSEGIKTYYYTDNLNADKGQSIQNKKAGDQISSALSDHVTTGSSIVVNGGPEAKIGEPLRTSSKSRKTIGFSKKQTDSQFSDFQKSQLINRSNQMVISSSIGVNGALSLTTFELLAFIMPFSYH